MVALSNRPGEICRVRVITKTFGKKVVQVQRQMYKLNFSTGGLPAWDAPAGVSYWHDVKNSELPELNIFLSKIKTKPAE